MNTDPIAARTFIKPEGLAYLATLYAGVEEAEESDPHLAPVRWAAFGIEVMRAGGRYCGSGAYAFPLRGGGDAYFWKGAWTLGD